MRYDIQFKLKDYIGALTYSFTGDDDLWVVMDGNRVVSMSVVFMTRWMAT